MNRYKVSNHEQIGRNYDNSFCSSDLTSSARYMLRYRVRKDNSFIEDVNYRTRSILTRSIQLARIAVERRRLIRGIDRYSSRA